MWVMLQIYTLKNHIFMIPYSKQDINEADIKAVVKTLRGAWLTQGPAIVNFEKVIAKCADTKFSVVFSSGTAALHAAYFAAGIGKGDEVIIPALTFVATANAALYLGARPVFADIYELYGTLDPKEAEKKITKNTKAIVPVDYGGRPADMNAFRKIARKHKLVLISDAAHSLGGSYKGRVIGSQADMTMFSFHPVKSITTGEGGAIVTNNPKYYEALKMFRSHGITKDPARLLRKNKAAWYQEMQDIGFNYRITDIQAALGRSQLKRLKNFVIKRRVAAKRYDKLLAGMPGLILPPKERTHERSAWHLYPVCLSPKLSGKRDEIFTALRAAGIGVQMHYLPVYRHVYYENLGYKKGLCPKTEGFTDSEITIPLFPGITAKQQRFIAKVVKDTIASFFNIYK
jgi:UDP-4-amino-4,6-dideoxy-N-acetyl-beta-L-altrosamine transaminase